MNKNYFLLIVFLVIFVFLPIVAHAAPTGTVNSIVVSIDNVKISNQELSGKIDFLPVISYKDVMLDFGLGACWDGGNFEVTVDNKINNTTSVISGSAPHLSSCSDWFNSPATPASYTLWHDRTFTGQTVTFEYPGNIWPSSQQMKIRVYEDAKRTQSNSALNNKFKGYIMLNTEDAGKAYYISPTSKKAYYLAIPKISFQVMRGTGVGITNSNLSKIPVGDSCPDYMPNCDNPSNYDLNFANQNKGYIFLQVEENGEAWYVYPKDGKRYFLGTPENAFEIMKNKGWGINNSDFKKLELAYGGDDQVVNYLSYTNKDNNFTINYPENWTYKEGSEFSYAFHVFFSSGESSFGILPKGELDYGLPRVKPIETSIILGGKPAIRKDYLQDNGNILIIINFSDYPDSWNENNRIQISGPQSMLELFNEMLNTFTFTGNNYELSDYNVSEFEISLKVNQQLANELTHYYNESTDCVSFSTKTFSQGDSSCLAEDGPLGSLCKEGMTEDDNRLVAEFDNFSLYFFTPHAPCSENNELYILAEANAGGSYQLGTWNDAINKYDFVEITKK